ncbi:hypothetical protein FNF29_03883 [Cafeteria roenbergensis]|uniref:Uncharacterized protein n=1 Tax=Cafeteria roenbergensis TaxID=33653 RepID=A0A5A8CI72_CAFRO|nr:hypothetical protein FNF29_03883 [Cafeteria roenbergensis]|eukprot:KAA0152317.1 hypothetical protein FNF29_03883 [Cafeteria roenbergensis]
MALMTRAALEAQYADIEAILLQAIDGQDVREGMDDDSELAMERQARAEDCAEFLLSEGMLLTALELHQEAREPGRKLAPLRALEEQFGSAAAVEELMRTAGEETSRLATESAGVGAAAAGMSALSTVANPVSAGGLATALEAREQAIAVAEYRLRGAQRDAQDAVAALDAARAEAEELRAQVAELRAAALQAGSEPKAAGAAADGKAASSSPAAPVAAAVGDLSDSERARLDAMVLAYLRDRGFGLAAVALEEAAGPATASAAAASADGQGPDSASLPALATGTLRPLKATREAAARERETAARLAEAERKLAEAAKEVGREVAARRVAEAEAAALRAEANADGGRAQAASATAAGAGSAAGGAAEHGPGGASSKASRAAAAAAAGASDAAAAAAAAAAASGLGSSGDTVAADPRAVVGRLAAALPRLAALLGARQRVALLPLFAGTIAAHPEAAVRRKLLAEMCTVVKRPRAAERAALGRELASVARAAAEGGTGVFVVEAEVAEAVVGLATHRARERRAVAALACGVVARFVKSRDALVATLSMLAGRGPAKAHGEAPLVRRAVIRGASEMAAALSADAEALAALPASESAGPLRALRRQYSSLLELLWAGMASGAEETDAGATGDVDAAGEAEGPVEEGEDEDDDDSGDGNLGHLLRIGTDGYSFGRASGAGGSHGADQGAGGGGGGGTGAGMDGGGGGAGGAGRGGTAVGEPGADSLGGRANGLAAPPSLPLLATGRLLPAMLALAHRLGSLWGQADLMQVHAPAQPKRRGSAARSGAQAGGAGASGADGRHGTTAAAAKGEDGGEDEDGSSHQDEDGEEDGEAAEDSSAAAADAAGDDALLPAIVGRLAASINDTARGAASSGRDPEAAAAEAACLLRALASLMPALRRLVLLDGYAVSSLGPADESSGVVDVVIARLAGEAGKGVVLAPPGSDTGADGPAASSREGASADAREGELQAGTAVMGDEAGDAGDEGGEPSPGQARHLRRQADVLAALLGGEALLARRSGDGWEPVPQRLASSSGGAGEASKPGYHIAWPALRRFVRTVMCAGILAAAGRASPSTAAGRRVRAAAASSLRVATDVFGTSFAARAVRPVLHWAIGLPARPAEDGPGDDGAPFSADDATSGPPVAVAAAKAVAALGLRKGAGLPADAILMAQVMLGTVSGGRAWAAGQGSACVSRSSDVAAAGGDASRTWRGWWQLVPELEWARAKPGSCQGAGVRLAEALLPAIGSGLLGSPRLPRPLLMATLRSLLVLPVQGRGGWGSAQRPHVEAAVASACAGSPLAASAVLAVLQRVATNSDPLTREAVGATVGGLLAASAVPEAAMMGSALPILTSLCADDDARVRRAAVRGAASLFATHQPGPLLKAAGTAAAGAIARGPKSVVLEAMRGFARAVPRAAPSTRDGPLLDRVIEVSTAMLDAASAGHEAMIDACRQIGGEAAVIAVTGSAAPGLAAQFAVDDEPEQDDPELTAAAAAAARRSRDAAVQGAAPWGGAVWDDIEEVATACAEALRSFAPSAPSMAAESLAVWRSVCEAVLGDKGEGRRVGILDDGYRGMALATMGDALTEHPPGGHVPGSSAAASRAERAASDASGASSPGSHSRQPSSRTVGSAAQDPAPGSGRGAGAPAKASAGPGKAPAAASAPVGEETSLADFLSGGPQPEPASGAAAAATGADHDSGPVPFVPDDAPTGGKQGVFGRLRGGISNARSFLNRGQR